MKSSPQVTAEWFLTGLGLIRWRQINKRDLNNYPEGILLGRDSLCIGKVGTGWGIKVLFHEIQSVPTYRERNKSSINEAGWQLNIPSFLIFFNLYFETFFFVFFSFADYR